MTHIPILKLVSCFFYNLIGKALPLDSMPYSKGFKNIRYFLFSNCIENCGKNIKIDKNVYISPSIRIGNNVRISENVKIRKNTFIGHDVLIGPGVQIITATHNFEDIDRPVNAQGESQLDIHIGNDVWIGTNAILLPGITISSHVIVAAGSIVTKDVSEFAIVAGNPAKIIRYRHIKGNNYDS